MTTRTFGPDGRTLVAGGLDSFIEIWTVTDPANPTKFATLRGADDQGNPRGLQPGRPYSGHAGASNKTIQLRETDIGDATGRICASTAPALTQTEWDRYVPSGPTKRSVPDPQSR